MRRVLLTLTLVATVSGAMAGGLISGNSGVNQYFARTKIGAEGSFRLRSPGIVTTRQVGERQRMQAEAEFLNALASVHFVRIDADGITLETDDQTNRLRFRPKPVAQQFTDLLNVELALVHLAANGKELVIPPSVSITLTFQDNNRFSGQSAVNSYAGTYTNASGAISLQSIVATQIAGPPELMEFESAYFNALSLVRQISMNGKLIVLQGDGTTIEFEAEPRQ